MQQSSTMAVGERYLKRSTSFPDCYQSLQSLEREEGKKQEKRKKKKRDYPGSGISHKFLVNFFFFPPPSWISCFNYV